MMWRPTAKDYEVLGEYCSRWGGRTKGVSGVNDTRIKITESTNLGPMELIAAELPSRKHTGDGPRTPAHI